MKPWLVIVIITVVSAGTWWSLSNRGDQEDTSSDASSLTVAPGVDAERTETSESEPTVTKSTKEDDADQLDGKSIAETSNPVQEPADDDSSTPFAVVGDGPQETAQAVQDEPTESAPVTNTNPAVPLQEARSEPRAVVPVNVPDSYPVTEAGKYFIPRDEREPGNLGGPPPLNFPGGPSDPDRQLNEELQAPVAPGQ